MERVAAAREPVQDLAATFGVELEAHLVEAKAAAHELAHRAARERERVGYVAAARAALLQVGRTQRF